MAEHLPSITWPRATLSVATTSPRSGLKCSHLAVDDDEDPVSGNPFRSKTPQRAQAKDLTARVVLTLFVSGPCWHAKGPIWL